LDESFQKSKTAIDERLKNLKQQANKELDDLNTAKDAKVDEFNGVIRDLQGKANDLASAVIDKQKLLDALNKSIEGIKARLTI
jgi:peptidoglycan hydrolase CwlO-like protein